ncbi:hypothetical protein MUP46_01185 [Patescibacteria group bacterium]|nr:hypothetical protein [Patescibacteria group bacterium]
MTDRDALKAVGLTDDEIDEMVDLGKDTVTGFDTEAAYKIAQKYLDIGDAEKATELLDVAFKTSDFWQELVQDLTGTSISYVDEFKHWRNNDTGQWTFDPYNVVRQSDSDFNQALIEKYGS